MSIGVIRDHRRVGASIELRDSIVTFDATVEESTTDSVDIASHPVESGARITDHVRKNPVRLRMTVVVSNTPLFELAAPRRELDYWELFRLIQDAGEVVVVSTPLRTYTDMMLKSIDVNRDQRTGQALSFELEWEQLRFAQAVTVLVQRPVRKRASKATKKGDKPTKALASEPQTQQRVEQQESVLFGLTS